MSRLKATFAKVLAVTAASTLLVACGGGSDGDKTKTGTLKVGITDAPVDYAYSVVIKFAGIELKPANGAAFTISFTPEKEFDLLQLTGTTRAMLIDGVEVPAGNYEWMRLKVIADPNVANDSYLMLEEGGQQCEMMVPSGDQNGLKVVSGFTVAVGSVTDFTIDFDLRKSLVAPPGQETMVNTCGNQAYFLKPVLRMVNNLQVGAIHGTVDPNLIAAECASPNEAPYPGNVYLFGPIAQGALDSTVMPDDYDAVPNDPNGADALTSAMVDPNTGEYTIGFIAPGRYKVAYTCDLDDAGVDADVDVVEEVVFTPADGLAVDVAANVLTDDVNFLLGP